MNKKKSSLKTRKKIWKKCDANAYVDDVLIIIATIYILWWWWWWWYSQVILNNSKKKFRLNLIIFFRYQVYTEYLNNTFLEKKTGNTCIHTCMAWKEILLYGLKFVWYSVKYVPEFVPKTYIDILPFFNWLPDS